MSFAFYHYVVDRPTYLCVNQLEKIPLQTIDLINKNSNKFLKC